MVAGHKRYCLFWDYFSLKRWVKRFRGQPVATHHNSNVQSKGHHTTETKDAKNRDDTQNFTFIQCGYESDCTYVFNAQCWNYHRAYMFMFKKNKNLFWFLCNQHRVKFIHTCSNICIFLFKSFNKWSWWFYSEWMNLLCDHDYLELEVSIFQDTIRICLRALRTLGMSKEFKI